VATATAGTVCVLYISINAGPNLMFGISSIPPGVSYCTGMFVVPAGASYAVTVAGWSAPAIIEWNELR